MGKLKSRNDEKNRKCILLFDDDEDTTRIVTQSLKQEGFDTVIVTDEDSAVNLAEKIKPDIIIMDEVTPGCDDVSAIDQIRQHSNVPIIMLNQLYEMGALKTALSHGADDYIQKPFSLNVFIARIRAKMRRAAYRHTYAHAFRG